MNDSIIMAIDPGPATSGVAVIRSKDKSVLYTNDKADNGKLISLIREHRPGRVAIEGIESYGMAVGETTFRTCYVIGALLHAVNQELACPFLIGRGDVKLHLCQSKRAKDPNVRQALIDKYPASGGGKLPQVGTKKKPGPLYGVSGHAWSALALAVAFAEGAPSEPMAGGVFAILRSRRDEALDLAAGEDED